MASSVDGSKSSRTPRSEALASVTDGRVVILPLGFEVFSLDHLLSDHGHPSYAATGQIAQLAMRAVCSAVMRGRSADAVPLNRTTNVGAPQMPTDGDRSRWCAAGGTKRVVRVGAASEYTLKSYT